MWAASDVGLRLGRPCMPAGPRFPRGYLEVLGTYNWLHNCGSKPLIRPRKWRSPGYDWLISSLNKKPGLPCKGGSCMGATGETDEGPHVPWADSHLRSPKLKGKPPNPLNWKFKNH